MILQTWLTAAASSVCSDFPGGPRTWRQTRETEGVMGRRGFGLLPHTPALIQSGHMQRSLGACVRGGRSWTAGASPPSREAVPCRGFLTLGLWAGQVFFMALVFLSLQ